VNKIFIKKILRESIESILEARDTAHSIERFYGRLNLLVRNNSISPNEATNLTNNLKLVQDHNFPSKKSYAIKLGSFKVKKESPYYGIKKSGEEFYSVPDTENTKKESNGNEFWVIVRNNNISTLMLRLKSQLKNIKNTKDKLDVDVVISDIGDYIEDLSRHKKSSTKFKKIKLTNGMIVKFYPDINKFEDIKGNEIKLDDILDFLSEKDSEFIFRNI